MCKYVFTFLCHAVLYMSATNVFTVCIKVLGNVSVCFVTLSLIGQKKLYREFALKDSKRLPVSSGYSCTTALWQEVTLLHICSIHVCVYLNKAEVTLAACVATSRQEEETPPTRTSETATNPAPLGNRRTLAGCLHMHTNRHVKHYQETS